MFFVKMNTDDGTMLPFPPGDISFLYEIGSIQSFKPLSNHGPKSQPANIRIKVGDDGIPMTLWFDFLSGN